MAKFYTPTKLSENIRETPEGYLLCLNVPIARTGWQEYGAGETPLEVGPNGIIKIYREPDEVFRPETIASFQGKALTIKHPEDFVSPENWNYLAKGTAHNVRRGGEKDEDGEEPLLSDLLVTDKMAIDLIKNGLREISCGYEAEYEQTGEGKGRQYNIIGNHIALVENARAGSTYAINDSNERVILMKKFKELAEQLRNLGKTIDEAMKSEEKPAKDEGEEKEKKEASEDAGAYDELVKMVKDLGEKIEGMKKASDEEEEKSEDADEEEKAKDDEEEEKSEDGEEMEMKIEERLKALEAAVAKILEAESKEAGDEDEEEMSGSEDEEEEKSEESEDGPADVEKSGEVKKTGDAALAEILAPGIKVTKGEDLHIKALKTAYKTAEGKEVLESLSGGKKLTFDSKEQNAMLFRASAELLKAKRKTGLEGTKDGARFLDDKKEVKAPITAEMLNEVNAQFWANRKK